MIKPEFGKPGPGYMTRTEFNLMKHINHKDLRMIESDIKAVRSNLKAKEWVLAQKARIPRQDSIDALEGKYRLDYYKYSSLCYIYAVILHVPEEEAIRILGRYPVDFLNNAIYEELYGTNRYEKVMDEYNELMNIPEILNYIEYFGGKWK